MQVCEDVGEGVGGEEVGGGRMVALLEQLLLSRMIMWRGKISTTLGPNSVFTMRDI